MEAKDTVMEIAEIRELFKDYPKIKTANDLNNMFRHLAQSQAEIFFKAGREEGVRQCLCDEVYDEAKRAGIREVVETLDAIDRDADDTRDFTRRVCDLIVEYQAKLKEWRGEEN